MSLFRKKNTGKHLSDEEKEHKFWTELRRTMATTSKQLVWLFSINGVLWIWCSYILAFIGKEQVVETLSSSVCTVVIGELVVYILTSTVENVFKYGNFSSYKTNNAFKERGNSNERIDPSQVGPDDDTGAP